MVDLVDNKDNSLEAQCGSRQEQTIKPIDKGTVHRICSGQVVLSLAIAMKELVENSLDAGAKNISIHLKEYGSELLEVSDNGTGVSEENFQVLTLKHYTSKIESFEDLSELSTLGFRGEALSSLCALCNLSIITKHHSAEYATKIVYDTNGRIKEKTIAAREQGTTVTLENLFSSLPVRRKEFLKNLKRDFSKMCQLLFAYCLVSKGIKFTCSNTTNKGNRNIVVSTDGNNSVRENIINIFGAKQISTVMEVDMVKPNEQICEEYNIKLTPDEELPFTFEFLISSVIHGYGRSSTDRQFYFINGRPCEPSKLIRLVNEVYKKFNSMQYPFVYLNIITKALTVDVNVTPDKRQVFLENENLLLATAKASLLEVFKKFPSTYQMQNLNLSQNCSQEKGTKRSLSETIVKSENFFTKKSKSEDSIKSSAKMLDLTIFSRNKSSIKTTLLDLAEKHVKLEVDRKLDEMVKTACKFVPELKEFTVDKQDESDKLKTAVVEGTNAKVHLDSQSVNSSRVVKPIDISWEDIKNRLQQVDGEDKNTPCIKFRSEIAPESNKRAEEELQKQISKSDFARMKIIGQFNLGFIITQLDNDLFIIDQHATDEKYNFEQLQQTTMLQSQVLVNPKPLELTAGNESLLIENIEIFRKNGFMFRIDESAPCTKKVALTAVPMAKSFIFGRDDIDEMLFMLQESGNSMCRPSRLQAILASKACRKSVMIGTALSKQDMRKLVDHMGEIDQPWNCPHGRPTMRHLINLDLLKNHD